MKVSNAQHETDSPDSLAQKYAESANHFTGKSVEVNPFQPLPSKLDLFFLQMCAVTYTKRKN